MISGWLALFTLVAYVCALAALARFAERAGGRFDSPRMRRTLYVLGCCVFAGFSMAFGIIETGARLGLDALFSCIPPIIVFLFCSPVIVRMIQFIKRRRITSPADFIASYYQQVQSVAIGVTFATAIGSLPFGALQINDITASLSLFIGDGGGDPILGIVARHLSLVVACCLAFLTVAVAPRRLDVTEHQRGLVLVVAAESLVKFAAFMAVAIYVTYVMFDGLSDLLQAVRNSPRSYAILTASPDVSSIATTATITMCFLLVAPQFHMTIIENRDTSDVRSSAWVVPLYALAIGLFSLPIAMAGLLILPNAHLDINHIVLALSLRDHSNIMALVGLIGGVAASTSILVVGVIAAAIMVSNNAIVPLLLRPWFHRRGIGPAAFAPHIVNIRRVTVVVLFACHYVAANIGQDALVAITKVLLVLFVQNVLPFLFTFFMARPPKAINTMFTVSGLVWLYTMVIPTLAPVVGPLSNLTEMGPLGIGFLRPTALFGLQATPFVHGLFWSLAVSAVILAVGEIVAKRMPAESKAVGGFVRRKTIDDRRRDSGSRVTVGDLKAAIMHYLGPDRTGTAFDSFFSSRGIPFDPALAADEQDLRFGETLLASAIGTASSRLVMSLLMQPSTISSDEVFRLIDGVSAEIQDGNVLLYQALAGAQQGIVFFDRNLTLVAFNRGNFNIFQLADDQLQIGTTTLPDIVRDCAGRGLYGPGKIEDLVAMRLAAIFDTTTIKRMRLKTGKVFDLRSVQLPDGALCLMYMDVTDQAAAEQQLEAHNETLERRVRERTLELELLNAALVKAKGEAEEANISKTRFLAAASHDILQPLNAARLYATSLKERVRARGGVDDSLMLALKVEDSLEAVEDILTALLDISRLDAGATRPEITIFRANDIFKQLQLEFEPISSAKGLAVRFMPSSLPIVSDRRLLRRLLQNIISNAIKYTSDGRVIVGIRRRGDKACVEIWDTGLGIPKSKQRDIFREFERLPNAVKAAPGVGLGLSIVERLNRILGHEVGVRSKPGRGSVFSVLVPTAPFAPNTTAFPSRAVATGKQRSLEGLVVVALDNEPTILAGMEAMLGGWDCDVVVGMDLASLEEGLKRRNLLPDVIIADYHLGESNGIAIIEALRLTYGSGNAILVTADRSPHVRELAHEADIRVLNKPLKPAALRSLLSQWRLVKQAAE